MTKLQWALAALALAQTAALVVAIVAPCFAANTVALCALCGQWHTLTAMRIDGQITSGRA